MVRRSYQGVSLSNHLLILAVLSLVFCCWSDDTGVDAVEFYTRYPEYPPYCSTPDEVAKRSIPPLSTSAKLLHVTAIFRHGARTPWGPGLNCWEGYHSDPVTSVWDCNLTADSAPPIPQRAAEEGANVVDMEDGSKNKNVWFEKRYDALQFPQYNLSNELNGTCQVGQLIDQGYSQEIANGKFLREAYATPNATVGFLAITPKDLYFRVDDEPRTVMSGQLVIRGLLGSSVSDVTIPLHTADFDRDIVDPNESICPRLGEIAKTNRNSAEYQAFLSEHQSLRDFQRDVLKPPQANLDIHAIDCLMTTMCTDRPLPDAVNDYRSDISDEWDDQYGPNRFQRLYEYNVQKYTMNLKANDAEYAKVGMGPLWYEILQQIRPVLNGHSDYPKMHIVSGHDTTVMPLLAALDPKLWPDKEWPSYASMIALELYTMNNDDSFFFRLVYNGKILTPSGCDDHNELCDIQVLLDRVEPFAIPNPDCQLHDTTPPSPGNPPTTPIDTESTSTLTTVNSFGSLFFVIGAILGALVTHIAHRRCGSVTNATPLPSDDHDGIMRNGRVARHEDDDDNNSLI